MPSPITNLEIGHLVLNYLLSYALLYLAFIVLLTALVLFLGYPHAKFRWQSLVAVSIALFLGLTSIITGLNSYGIDDYSAGLAAHFLDTSNAQVLLMCMSTAPLLTAVVFAWIDKQLSERVVLTYVVGVGLILVMSSILGG